MVLPSMPCRISRRHGQMPNDSGFGHGMCQNVRMVAFGQFRADHRGQQGEVVILHQHHRVFAAGLGHHGIGEALVHRAVLLPVRLAEHRPHVGDVAQRPQPFVGEPVVVAPLLFLGEPQAAQQVFVVPRRQRNPVMAVHRVAVRAAAAVRDPRARAGAHHRLHGGHQAAGGPAHDDAAAFALMEVGLAVGHHDDLVAAQLRAQQRLQALRVPLGLRALGATVLVLEVAQARPQVGRERSEFRGRAADRPHQPFAAQQRPRARDPAPPAELGDDHRDQRDHAAEAADQDDEVLARVLAATLDEAQVLQQHELPDAARLRGHRIHAHVHRPAADGQQRVGLGGDPLGAGAVQGLRETSRWCAAASCPASTSRWPPGARPARRG